jgi:hypothetical protein
MLKIFNKNKALLILYTGILIFFTAFSLNNSDSTTSFSATKPKILVINNEGYHSIRQSQSNFCKGK